MPASQPPPPACIEAALRQYALSSSDRQAQAVWDALLAEGLVRVPKPPCPVCGRPIATRKGPDGRLLVRKHDHFPGHVCAGWNQVLPLGAPEDET
jgi:hypothetical protein